MQLVSSLCHRSWKFSAIRIPNQEAIPAPHILFIYFLKHPISCSWMQRDGSCAWHSDAAVAQSLWCFSVSDMRGDGSVGFITRSIITSGMSLRVCEAVVGGKKEKSLAVYFHSGGKICVCCCCCGRVFGRLKCFAESWKLRKMLFTPQETEKKVGLRLE